MKYLSLLIALLGGFACSSQQPLVATIPDGGLPYASIPSAPAKYNAATVAARSIDGLGFRYYWATEGLQAADLSYKPGPTNRSMGETIDHVYDLAELVINSMRKTPNIRPRPERPELSLEEKRAQTLYWLKEAADILRQGKSKDLEAYTVIFQRGEQQTSYPFWNQLNGPIADALWHTGQIVAFRRAAGNPLPPGVNVFMGTREE